MTWAEVAEANAALDLYEEELKRAAKARAEALKNKRK